MKKLIQLKSILAASILLFPFIASANFLDDLLAIVIPSRVVTQPDAIDTALALVNDLIVVVIAIATLVFLYGVIQYVISKGDEKQLATGRTYMLYGIIGLVVMVSVWGFVNLLVYTIFSASPTTSLTHPESRNVPYITQ